MREPMVTILLVDDEPRNLDALEAILDGQGYSLLRAEDADRALRMLLEHDVAAIILDIKMPRVNGIELAQIIKGSKRFRQIPILFLTAHLIEDQDVVAGYGAGAVDYLTKPFNPQILSHKIAVFADLFRKTRALAELNELRNPLAPIRTGLDLLMQMQAPTAAATRTLTIMNRQLDHIVRLIDDLLDISRITRGVLELKKERVDLKELIVSTAETFRPLLEQRDISMVVTCESNLRASVDSTRIAQILGNLLHNASKFTPPRGTVEVELTARNGRAIVRVHDTGIGIPEDQLDRIFEMFARVQRASSAMYSGAGIGLALARQLAELHDGELTATSAGDDLGSTFVLSLPDVEVSGPGSGAHVAIRQRVRVVNRLNILVIEDNDDAADLLAVWLQELGHQVTVARTGATGLELVLAMRPQLVLCDVGLPEMDGIEVCQRVRQIAGDFRPTMVALTGWGKEEDRLRTKNAGFDHHLVKPVALDRLSEILGGVDISDSSKLPS
jgi:signal transduction histidine kinase